MIAQAIAGVVEGVANGANNLVKTIWGSKDARDTALAEEQALVLQAYTAEFGDRTNRTFWDSFVEGINRTVRPACTYGALGLVTWACIDPEEATLAFTALATVPDWLWATLSGIMAFWFGSRMIERLPTRISVDPAKLELAKDIARLRLAAKQEEEEKKIQEAKAEAVEKEAMYQVQAWGDTTTTPEIRKANATIPTALGDTSVKGINLIKRFEGFRSAPYLCPAGIWTIGYGHTQGVSAASKPISEAEGERLLKEDLDRFERIVLKHVNVPLEQHEFDALVSFVFNLGEENFKKSTLLRKLNQGDKQGAADEFLRWNKARVNGNLVPLQGLSRRREAERKLFLGVD